MNSKECKSECWKKKPEKAEEKVANNPTQKGRGKGDEGNSSSRTDSTDPQEDLRCPICMDYFIDPAFTDCAHVFCSFCIHFWFENRGRSICPQCRNTVEHVIASPDLNEKVEKYVKANLSQEQLEERERTRQMRLRDIQEASANLSPLREQFAMYSGADMDDLFWSFTIEQPSGGFTFWSSSVTDGGMADTFNQFMEGYNSVGNNPDAPATPEFQDDLTQFEYRLERAQGAYESLLHAQSELNHQMDHLSTISSRLEAYRSLRDQTHLACCPACEVEINANPDVLTEANSTGDSNATESLPPVICTDCMSSWPWLPCSSYQYFPSYEHTYTCQGSCTGHHQQGHWDENHSDQCSSRARTRTRTFRRHHHQNNAHQDYVDNSGDLFHARSHYAVQQDGYSGDYEDGNDGNATSRPGTAGFAASISIETELTPMMEIGVNDEEERWMHDGRIGRSDRHSPTPSFMGL